MRNYELALDMLGEILPELVKLGVIPCEYGERPWTSAVK